MNKAQTLDAARGKKAEAEIARLHARIVGTLRESRASEPGDQRITTVLEQAEKLHARSALNNTYTSALDNAYTLIRVLKGSRIMEPAEGPAARPPVMILAADKLAEISAAGASEQAPRHTEPPVRVQVEMPGAPSVSPGAAAAQAAHLLQGREAVQYETAAKYLDITERQVRNLVKKGKLVRVGEGQYKTITTESLRHYKGVISHQKRNSEQSGTERN
ncbi:MAG: hypothetical protein DMG57_31710 [Acidobacteria bacterium]|nr:MAG: hypothetical protein DMG57_31710 [Acidobacteriota bacterium]